MACDSQIIRGRNLPAVAYVSEKREFNFSCMERKDSAVNQLIFGMIGMAMCQMTYFLAIQESNPGTATVIQYSAPILIMVFFVLVEKRFPKKEEVLVLAAVIVGIFLLATHGSIKN